MSGFFNSDKTVLSYSSLKKLFEDRGVTADKQVVSNCTAGIRSGYVYFLLRLMGYQRASQLRRVDIGMECGLIPSYEQVV